MTKKGVIGLSIFLGLLVLLGVLFCTVFCLRNQKVTVLGETPVTISREDIVTTAGFKNGKSIFMLDKEQAINNIEAKYPYVKVVQIKTIDLMTIEFRLRARHEMFYIQANENYYILDEELKVLNIINGTENEPTQLIKIESDAINIDASTLTCDFVGNNYHQTATYNLFVAMNTVVTKKEVEDKVYLTRADICDLLSNVDYEETTTSNKIIVTTKYGVKLDIEKPVENMQNKINICFSTIEEFLSSTETEGKVLSGTIKIYYDLDGNQKTVYIP